SAGHLQEILCFRAFIFVLFSANSVDALSNIFTPLFIETCHVGQGEKMAARVSRRTAKKMGNEFIFFIKFIYFTTVTVVPD
ncbi:hypothetical protein ACJX0J_033271, partial [Zea mays]